MTERRGFAYKTQVPADRSRSEIEKLLMAHGCSQYMTGLDYTSNLARVQFRAHERIIRFEVPLPARGSRDGEQLERQRWRQLLLVIKPA
jgi:hypothetical protein